jgi:hypothetical protein
MPDFDVPILPVVQPNDTDLMVESFDNVVDGQRTTDGRVSDGFLGTARQINQDVMYLDAEANRNAQFNARGQRDIQSDVANGFARTAYGQANTDRGVAEATLGLAQGQSNTDNIVTQGVLGLANGQANTDNNIGTATLGLAQGQANSDKGLAQAALGLTQGQANTDRNVDQGFRSTDREIYGVDKDVLQGFTGVASGQRDTDDRVSDGFQGTSRDIDAARRESAQGFWGVERGQRLSNDRNSDGFNRVERDVDAVRRDVLGGHASTDRNVDHGFFGVERGRNESDRNVDSGFRRTDDHLGRVELGQALTDRNVDNRSSQTSDHLGRVELGQAGINRNIDDQAARTSDHISRVELGQSVTDRNVDHGINLVGQGLNDSERRTDNRIDAAERRIEATQRHAYEELSRDANAADRRNEVRLTGISHDVASEGQLTRDAGQRGELETRLYLRDREDRTNDLIRQLADRNLFEMQAFERRDRDDHTRTRDLINHKDDLRAERDVIHNTALETQLRTKIDILESRHERHDHGRDRDGYRYDPRININLTDLVEDEARSGAAAFNRFRRDHRFDHNGNGNFSGNGNGNGNPG